MSFVAFRKLHPATLDTLAYSCMSRWSRLSSKTINGSNKKMSSDSSENQLKSENDSVNPEFINRNPRNLEFMGLAKRRTGWIYQYPSVNFYHKLMFQQSTRFLTAWVEHSSGKVIMSVSTKEYAIAKHLYRLNDISAAENIGRVLAQRCRECGITSMKSQPPDDIEYEKNFKFQAFLKAMTTEGVDLKEIRVETADYEPGIDYDDTWECDNLRQRQLEATKKTSAVWGTEKDNRI
jgi:large subunit ribosomal protein L18